MMKFKVLSREAFENFTSKANYIVISISDPNSEPVESQKGYKTILSLSFHDIDKKVKREDCKICKGTGKIGFLLDENNNPYDCSRCTDKTNFKVFDENMADQILDFVSTYALDVDLIVVHCEAGISRSAGVASALSLIYNREDQYYFDHYLPNMLVYRKIINMAVKKGFFSC